MLSPAEKPQDSVHAYRWWQGFDNSPNPPWEPPTILEGIPTPVKCVNSPRFIAFIEEVEVGKSRGKIRRVCDVEAKEMIIGVGNGKFTWTDRPVKICVPGVRSTYSALAPRVRVFHRNPDRLESRLALGTSGSQSPTNGRISGCRRSLHVTAFLESIWVASQICGNRVKYDVCCLAIQPGEWRWPVAGHAACRRYYLFSK